MTDCPSSDPKRRLEQERALKAQIDALRLEIARLRRENERLRNELYGGGSIQHPGHSHSAIPCDEDALLRARYASDMEVARQLQTRLNPVWLPQMPGIEIAVKYMPGEKASGDFYDIIELGDNAYGLLIADVSGSGLRAAVVMAVAKLAFRTFSANQFSPKAIMERVNAALCDSMPEGYYLAAFLGVIETDNMVLRYVNASQSPPLLVRDRVIRLDGNGLFVGMFDNPAYEEKAVELQYGDRLIMLTDGVLDRFGHPGDTRNARLDDLLMTTRNGALDDMVDILLSVPPAHGFPTEGDDLTILALEVKEKSPSRYELALGNDPSELCRAVRLIQGLLEAKGYGERNLFAVRLAVEEAITNAMRHGNKFDPSKKVFVTFSTEPDRAIITVRDEGEGFNPSDVPDPRDPAYLEKESGRGLFLIHAYMDEVTHNEKANAVTMVKYAPWAKKKSSGDKD